MSVSIYLSIYLPIYLAIFVYTNLSYRSIDLDLKFLYFNLRYNTSTPPPTPKKKKIKITPSVNCLCRSSSLLPRAVPSSLPICLLPPHFSILYSALLDFRIDVTLDPGTIESQLFQTSLFKCFSCKIDAPFFFYFT